MMWEGDVGKVAEGKSYAVNNGKMKLYEGMKYLSVTNETGVDKIDNLGDVSGSSSQVLEEYSICGEIISCAKVTHYLSCGICKNAKLTAFHQQMMVFGVLSVSPML